MSLELDWSLLDGELAQSLLAKLNRSLAAAARPDFIGPISLTSLDFGNDPPDVRLTQIGDVWRQFVDVEGQAAKDGATRRSARPGGTSMMVEDGDITLPGEEHMRPSQHLSKLAEQNNPFAGQSATAPRLQTFRQYSTSELQQVHGGGGSMASFPASIPNWANGSASVSNSGLNTPAWGAGLGNKGLLGGNHNGSGYFPSWQTPTPPSLSRPDVRRSSSFAPTHAGFSSGREGRSPAEWEQGAGDESTDNPPASAIPDLQMQFSVVWSTNTLKLGISTSLLVNHPTPAFMELPLSVSVIGLGVQAGCVVAFEEGDGRGRKVHLSLVEDDSTDSDAGESPQGVSGAKTTGNSSNLAAVGMNGMSSRHEGRSQPHQQMQPPQRPLTLGERLIPQITLESSVGQADKHVLRNVGKVEKFLIELIRKAVEDEVSTSECGVEEEEAPRPFARD